MFAVNNYYEPDTLEEALDLLAKKPHLTVIAGGTDILINMRSGKISDTDLLSIRNLQPLKNIDILEDGSIVIGPLVTFSQIINSDLIKKNIPLLAEAAQSMGGPQIRNMATLGGNICNGATSADSAPSLYALNAMLTLRSAKNIRKLPIRDFHLGPGKVDLKENEILTQIIIAPEDYLDFNGCYIKFSVRKAMDIATLGVAALLKVRNNAFEDVRIAMGVAAPTPVRCLEAENFARGRAVSNETIAEIGKLAVKATKARTSWRASREYREHLAEELTVRALRAAVQKTGGNLLE